MQQRPEKVLLSCLSSPAPSRTLSPSPVAPGSFPQQNVCEAFCSQARGEKGHLLILSFGRGLWQGPQSPRGGHSSATTGSSLSPSGAPQSRVHPPGQLSLVSHVSQKWPALGIGLFVTADLLLTFENLLERGLCFGLCSCTPLVTLGKYTFQICG